MLQYLINATATWLISLAMFDLFLRRETYHNYNRFYLLFTFLLGALLPLWQLSDYGPYISRAEQPFERVLTVKQNIVSAGALPAAEDQWQLWLTIAFAAGALIALCLLLIDVIKLVAFYKTGTKSRQGRWTIIETGKDHAPFSFLNKLFVSSKTMYNDDEWLMILSHEEHHTLLIHFADLLLMQLARIIFWFHPLVYIYNTRLLMVHEYQADNAAIRPLKVYGKFLIEQSLLQSAPAISHTFNRSPIKKRIVMLTKRSTTAAKSKMLVFLPLAVVCTLCFSKTSFSQRFIREGNKVTYRGNTFELSDQGKDTMQLLDPVTGKIKIVVAQKQTTPLTMNGKPILQKVDKQLYFSASDEDLQTYVLKKMNHELDKLDDGMYIISISNLVVDKNGNVVYFDYDDMHGFKIDNGPVSADNKAKVNVTFGADAPAEYSGKSLALNKSGPQIEIDN